MREATPRLPPYVLKAPTSVAAAYLGHTPVQSVHRAETGEEPLPVQVPESGKHATGCPKVMFTSTAPNSLFIVGCDAV